MLELNSREDFARLISERGYTVAAEIGVRAGGFSRFLLENTKLETLYSIDPWSADWPEFAGGENEARANLQQFGERSQIIKAASLECFGAFADGSLDFVYIDAGRDYGSVRTDIALFWHKVKSGGVIAGHDFVPCWPGVMQAVAEHSALYGLTLNVTGTSGKDARDWSNGEEWAVPSWWVEKP